MEIVDDRAWVEIATWTSPTPNGRFCSLSFTRNLFGSEGDHGKMPAPCSTGFFGCCAPALPGTICPTAIRPRSEEHTSELQSRLHLVCRLLLEKKKSLLSLSYLLTF